MAFYLNGQIPTPAGLPKDVFPIIVCVIIAVASLAFFAGKKN